MRRRSSSLGSAAQWRGRWRRGRSSLPSCGGSAFCWVGQKGILSGLDIMVVQIDGIHISEHLVLVAALDRS
jgi:hypothetical protein